MFLPILVICILAVLPVAVYSASTWPDEPRIDQEARQQRERFFDQLAVRQALCRERDPRAFEGTDRRRPDRHW